jgi:hypothetical protein
MPRTLDGVHVEEGDEEEEVVVVLEQWRLARLAGIEALTSSTWFVRSMVSG